jgi:PBP4 family serine-type D-alanyl-D-alanine carboxypeptidase
MYRHFSFSAMTICLIFVVFGFASAEPSNEHNIDYMNPYTGSAASDKITSLSDTWTRTETPHGKSTPLTFEYKGADEDSAAIETLSTGAPLEVVSLDYTDDMKLLMKHFCMLRNQPVLRLKDQSKNILGSLLSNLSIGDCNNSSSEGQPIPEEIKAVFNKELYDGSIWALRVLDLETGEVLYNQRSDDKLFLGSVRKVFTIGEALDALGPNFRFRTPIHRQGSINGQGVLEGDLILVAKGDLTMGGRRNPNGMMAISNFDHNEANSLGNAALTAPDPLSGYDFLAEQIADSGITEITREIIIDDRLFEPFEFRGEFYIRPIFVNDDVVDVIINPTNPGEYASVDHRPMSEAFDVDSTLITVSPGEKENIKLDPEFPSCIGLSNCFGTVTGMLPIDSIPPLTEAFPLIQTFRIVRPDNYARTVLIEALKKAGVKVKANPVGENPVELLPPQNSYSPHTLLAELVSLPYSEYAKLVNKVSYNIGADTSLVLWGLTEGVDNMNDALIVERENLTWNIGIPGNEFLFFDGSGGGDAKATNKAIHRMLKYISEQDFFPEFLASLPILGVDGSLGFVTDFESDPSLAGAKGNAFAKTGTFLAETDKKELLLKGQALAGYIDAKSGRRLIFNMFVNNVQLGTDFEKVLEVFQDQGTITAIIWRDN